MQLFVKDLTVIDFSYLCNKRGVVGESWIVDVTLDGDLNDQSMVLDFGIVKKQIKFIIDEAVDHKLLLPNLDANLFIQQSSRDDHLFVDFQTQVGGFFLQSPSCAFAKIESEHITVESVTEHLTKVILAELPSNVKGLTLNLRPEVITTDFYHYTHGLKKHDGNCQRIAHGHRSQIEIFENDTRSHKLEKAWCERWRDIYIATDEDEVTVENIELSNIALSKTSTGYRFFTYFAPQGRFDIAVPVEKLEVIDCDSTVELIADYIARTLKNEAQSTGKVKVVAYEGVGKGAIASV